MPAVLESLEKGLLHNDGTLPMLSPCKHTPEEDKKFSFPKIELHLHLDGSPRFSTLLDLSKKRGIPLGGATTVDELKKLLVTHEPASLSKVLEAFGIFTPVIAGDVEALERVAYETCEDQAAEGVVYFEARYAPHLLVDKDGKVKARDVVEAMHRGLTRGKADFGVDSRHILCCIRSLEQFDMEILELAENCKHLGVVAVDAAGSAHGADEQYGDSVKKVFQEAYKRGIHRTCHAGESGGAKEVILAIHELHAERIGHGYRILRDEEAYRKNFVEGRVHLEACPYSSVMTGSVPLDWPRHPLRRWAEDGVSFSLSRDDPTCFDNSPLSELTLVHSKIGLTVHQIWQCQLNAAEACFLDEESKALLIQRIKDAEPHP